MNRLGDFLPCLDVLRRGDARLREIGLGTEPLLLIGALGDDQPKASAGAAGVIGGHLVGRRAIQFRHLARERGHGDPVADRVARNLERRKESFIDV